MRFVPIRIGHSLEPKIFWVPPCGTGRHRGGDLVFLQTLILMGDWCRQVGTTRSETDTEKPKETTAKGEKLVTPLLYISLYRIKQERNGDSHKEWEMKRGGRKRFYSIGGAAAPTSHLEAHSRSRIVYRKPSLKKKGSWKIMFLLAHRIFFPLDRCLLNG